MGTKRVGLARVEALMENLKREISFGAGTKLVGARRAVESVTADTSLTAADCGKLYVFADAAAVLTLPDSGAGDLVGVWYEFYSNSQGSGQKVICSDTGNENLIGALLQSDDDADAASKVWNAQASDGFDFILLAGVATGKPGTRFRITNIAADVWSVEGLVVQSGGSEATPFGST